MKLDTSYMGIALSSPILVTDAIPDADLLAPIVDAGVGAVVLRPLLEEEIILDIKMNGREVAPVFNYGANLKVAQQTFDSDYVKRYLERISQLKQHLAVPIIASIDCYSFDAWFAHVRFFVEAGCDAIEFNAQLIPTDITTSYEDEDRLYNDLTSTYRRMTSVPFSIRVTPYQTDMASFAQRLSWQGVNNITLFNDLAPIDIDLQRVETVAGIVPASIRSIQWTALLKQQITCDLSTTVNDGEGVVKALLAGATTAHISHCGGAADSSHFRAAADTLKEWMRQHGHESIDSFRGTLVSPASKQGALAQRASHIEYMKKAHLR